MGTEAAAAARVLTFALGDETFALDIGNVREIVQVGPMTTVPLMPAFVRGVMNLRGAIVPVIDLHARFGRPRGALGKKSCIVIYDASHGGERAELGLLVDAVSEVVELAPDAQEPAPAFGATLRRDFIRAMGKLRGRFVVVVEPEKAFDLAEMAALCEGLQPA